ncbi:MAG: putative baseplate assembly protein, partial [Gammaproteobacteria bacterium]
MKLPEPEIDYLAKDYNSFRSLILDRISSLMPGWRERNPADLQIALVELLAYAGDHLSYFQDAVATEAYLGTARQRVSVRRHARLVDYDMHDGSSARAWVCVDVTQGGDADGKKLPSGTVLLTRGPGANTVVRHADLEAALIEGPLVFETLHELTLQGANNEIPFYAWSDSECCLPRGSTRATLLDKGGVSLNVGDVLVFEELVSPTTGTEADADPSHRHAVRLTKADAAQDPLDRQTLIEIEWHGEDALPFPLCLTARVETAVDPVAISVARGNVVLADYGRTTGNDSLVPPAVPENGDYRPRLQLADVTFRVPY